MNKVLLITASFFCYITAMGQSAQIPGEPTDFNVEFEFVDGAPTIKGSLVAPTHEQKFENPAPLTEIHYIEVTRSCYDVDEFDLPVCRFDNPEPGATLTFTDNEEFQMGYSYRYSARAYNSEGRSGYAAYQDLYTGIQAAKPEIISTATGDKGASPITLTVKAPTQTKGGKDLTVPLTSLYVTNYISWTEEVELDRKENPVSGENYTFTINVENNKLVSLRVYAATEYGTSEYTSVSLYVGEDVPAKPTSLTAVKGDNGIILTWEAPTEGSRNGYFDPAKTRYKVERGIGYDFSEIATDLTECTYIDECADITAPTEVSYRVTAFNEVGPGGLALTENSLLVGPAHTLPYIENFNVVEGYYCNPENLWVKFPTGYSSNWRFETGSWMYDNFTGVDGDAENEEGYAACSHSYSDPGDYDDLTSAAISLSGAKCPVLIFHYGAINGVDNRLTVKFTDNDEASTDLIDLGISENATEDKEVVTWIKKTLPLEGAADKEIHLVFHAYVPEVAEGASQELGNVYIDGIYLDDYPPVGDINVENTLEAINLSWTAPANSTVTADSYEITVNGAEPVALEEAAYSIVPEPDTDYVVTVRAIYGDIRSCLSEEVKVSSLLSGIGTINAASASVDYFDISGRKVTSPAKGAVLIKRTVGIDGSTRMEKVIYGK